MALPSYARMFRGHPACPCLIAWLPVYEAEAKRRHIIKQSIDIYQLIGTAAASGGTHAKGGAYDLAQVTPAAIKLAREMGAAAWHRPPDWDGHGGIEHHHGVLHGCPHNSPARYQISAYLAGYNGLGLNGMAEKDHGPRVLPLRTWRQGIVYARKLQHPRVAAVLDELAVVAKSNPTAPEVKRATKALNRFLSH